MEAVVAAVPTVAPACDGDDEEEWERILSIALEQSLINYTYMITNKHYNISIIILKCIIIKA